MADKNCGYCMGGETLDAFGIPICDLRVSKLILFREQTHLGRCIVAYKDHVGEMIDLTDDERNLFFSDVNRAAKAIHATVHPDKLNYGAYGDTGGHLHVHLVPKFRDQEEWGGTFDMNPAKKYLSQEEYDFLCARIVKNLV